jgi:hypothetical protein
VAPIVKLAQQQQQQRPNASSSFVISPTNLLNSSNLQEKCRSIVSNLCQNKGSWIIDSSVTDYMTCNLNKL